MSSVMNGRRDKEHGSYKAIDHQIAKGVNVTSSNVSESSSDSEESTNIGNIHIQVNVMDRKEGSVDTNYTDYLEEFDAEKYALQMDAEEKAKYYRTFCEDDPNVGTSLSQEEVLDDQILSMRDDMSDLPHEDLLNSLHTTGADCWYGYGNSMYFQPMTCKTLPCLRVRSHKMKPQMLNFSKRNSGKMLSESSPMFVRLDTAARKKLLDDLGTLKLAEDTATSKRSTPDRPRVGNFVMSNDLKTKVCKGVVSRTDDVSISSRKTVKHRKFPSSGFVACIKADLIPTQSGRRKVLYGKKARSSIRGCDKGTSISRSLESQDLFGCLPRLGQAPSYIDRTPKKKVVAGKPFYLSSSLQSINKLNLSPFCQPSVYSAKSGISPSSKQVLNCSPTTDDEEIIVNHLEETFVSENVQKINECEKADRKDAKGVSHEEQYAYDSLFSYYNDKLKDGSMKSGSLKKAIVTKSLISSHQNPRDNFTKPRSFENGFNHKGEKNEDANSANEKYKASHISLHMSETDLSLSGKSNLLHDMQKFEALPLKTETQITDHCEELLFPIVGENSLANHAQTNIISSDDIIGDLHSPASVNIYASKAVHFDNEENRILFDSSTSSEPFVATALKPADRYEISSNACRLPVIGQKITPNLS